MIFIDFLHTYRVIWSLALSLGMNQKELTRVITMIPRTLSLSVEGKLTQLLRVLSRFAVRYLVHNNGIYDDEIEPPNGRAGRKPSLDRELERESEEWKNDVNDMSDLNEGIIIDADGVFVDDINQSVIERNDIFAHLDAPTLDAIYRRRNHTVRSMIRDHVLRYPLLLSTSVEKVEARIGNIMSDPDLMKAFHWSDFVRALRRTEAQHRSWKKKVWSLALPFKSTVLGSTKPIYLKEPKSKLNFLSNSYDIETGILLDDSATQSVVRMANGFLMPTKYLKQPPVLPSNQDNSALSMWKSRLQSGKSPNEIDSEVTTATATVPDAFDSDISGDGKIKGPNKKLSISLRKKNSSK